MDGVAATEADARAVTDLLREVAGDLLADVDRLAPALTGHLLEQIPELGSGDPELAAETLASTASNLNQILRMLKGGTSAESLVMPVEAAEFVRGLALRGIPLPALLRSYRLGHGWFWSHMATAIAARADDPVLLARAQEQGSDFLFAYIDRMSGALVEAYGSERERLVRSAERLRADTVRAILADEGVDATVASGRLRYALDRHHVAVRVSGNTAALDRAVAEVSTALGSSEPLVVTSAMASLDGWIASAGPFGAEALSALRAYEPPAEVRVAVGRPGHGIDGFRRSHAEAQHAARVATLAGPVAAAVTSYADVEVVSLMSGDLPRARAFVAGQLGPLAVDDDAMGRLRETLLAFLLTGGSTSQTAKDLFVHHNTVTYRVKRAEELLGRRVTDDLLGLTAALKLAGTLGPAVLQAGGDG